MKQWLETRQVLERLAELGRAGTLAALATVIRVRGSAYRHEGAKLLVAADGSVTGNVSGGCLEQDVREVAHLVIEVISASETATDVGEKVQDYLAGGARRVWCVYPLLRTVHIHDADAPDDR